MTDPRDSRKPARKPKTGADRARVETSAGGVIFRRSGTDTRAWGSTEDPLAFPPFTRARRVRAELVTGILRSGRPVPDETFDEIYPEAVRSISSAVA